MDTEAIDAAGTAPLKPYLAEIDAAKTRAQLLALFVKPGFASPVDLDIDADFKNPTRYSAFASQATLGMPSREYYLDDSAKMKAHRAAYRDYIVTIEKLAGLPGGEAAADRIIALETALSKAQWPRRRAPRHRQDLQPDDARAADHAGASVPMELDARQGGSRQARNRSSSPSLRRSPAQARSSPRRRCRPGRSGSHSASFRITRRCSPRRSTMRASPSTRRS